MSHSVLRAGRDRLRPILMAALTTVPGLLPLALGKAGLPSSSRLDP